MNPLRSAPTLSGPILRITPLGFPWETPDPFLFCVHHDDRYPAGNDHLGPAASLAGRDMGQDFAGKDGWRMYHGQDVPGFPQHPHRGFETVTLVRTGLIDYSDSLGATARFGEGDVQWLTAGKGICHSEMFPLVHSGKPNPAELFQIWLNLPRADKMVAPYFSMLWAGDIPHLRGADASGRGFEVTAVAGSLPGITALSPPPNSWASRPESDVAIWLIALSPGARWTLSAAHPGSHRRLYLFEGDAVSIAGQEVLVNQAADLQADAEVDLVGGSQPTQLLMLQGRPIGEPVVQYGPFVMNSRLEIQQAMADYQRDQFGGWPFPSDEPIHPREQGRFARHADGRIERPR